MKKLFILFFLFLLLAVYIASFISGVNSACAYKLKKGGYWRDTEKGSVSVMGGKFTIPFNKTFFVCQNNKNARPYVPPVKPDCKFSEHTAGSNTIIYSIVCRNQKGVMKSKGMTRIFSPVKFISKIKTVVTGAAGNSSISNFTINGYRTGNVCK